MIREIREIKGPRECKEPKAIRAIKERRECKEPKAIKERRGRRGRREFPDKGGMDER